MTHDYFFTARVQKFPGSGGWHYVAVPEKYTKELKGQRKAWGSYPIIASVGAANWETKLMMKKGGDFFIAFKAALRKKESIALGQRIKVSFTLD